MKVHSGAPPLRRARVPPPEAPGSAPAAERFERVGAPRPPPTALARRAGFVGVVSDLDQTLIPRHDDVLPARAYPGVATLLTILEHGHAGPPGDTHYVTARSPEHMEHIPAWMSRQRFPAGPIRAGRPMPAGVAPEERDRAARDGKIRTIGEILRASPAKAFVLLGDSSHVDPDVARTLLARFPRQIVAAVIHDVKPLAKERALGLDVVRNYAEAAAVLAERGVLDRTQAEAVIDAAVAEGLELTSAERQALHHRLLRAEAERREAV